MKKKYKKPPIMQRRRLEQNSAPAQGNARQVSGGETRYFVHGPHGLHSQQEPDGSWRTPLQDGLGSIRGVTDEMLDPLESCHYDPFGNMWDVQGAAQTPFGFTGEMTDPNGLVYLRNRYYDPTLGVFPSPDSIPGNIQQPMSLNSYSYVQNNPVNWVDPSGMIPQMGNPLQSASISNPMGLHRLVESINSGCYSHDPLLRRQECLPVYVSCTLGQGATPHSVPVLGSRQVGPTLPSGTQLCNFEERYDSQGLMWVRIDEYGTYNGYTRWIVRRDPMGNNILEDGTPKGCPQFTPVPVPSATPTVTPLPNVTPRPTITPSLTSMGPETVARVIACEAGGDDDQAVDVAYAMQARMQSGLWGNSVKEVIAFLHAFQCYTEMTNNGQIYNYTPKMLELAQALIDNNPLPYPPSTPGMQTAMHFYGVWYQGLGGYPASAVSKDTIIANLIQDGICAAPNLGQLYVGHTNFNEHGYTTVFFSDNPECVLPNQ
jgi:RHS repeat-associated protein